MKTFTEEEKAEAISLLTSEEMARAAIEVPLQKMFDEFKDLKNKNLQIQKKKD